MLNRYTTQPALHADATLIVDEENLQQVVDVFQDDDHEGRAERFAELISKRYRDAIEKMAEA